MDEPDGEPSHPIPSSITPEDSAEISSPPVWVEVSRLMSEERATYKAVDDLQPRRKSDIAPEYDEIIGEYLHRTPEKATLWYFARYQRGVARKYKAKKLKQDYPELVKEYNRRKAAGKLPFEPFDPSSHYVHPLSRFNNVVNLRNRTTGVSSVPSVSNVLSTSEDDQDDGASEDEFDDEESSDDAEDDEDDEYGSDGVRVRKSARIRRNRNDLPFSPRKTRSQKVFVISDADDDSDTEEPSNFLRSTRSRKTIRVALDQSDASENEDSDEGAVRPVAKRKKGNAKVSPPAYGNVRPIEAIYVDALSDEETAPLREHRAICEKCGDKPAHEIVGAEKKKPKKKARRKKKTSDDEFLESGDEVERATKLGGWARCLRCAVSSHWKCLPSNQRDEILKAIRDKDREAWRSSFSPSDFIDGDGNEVIPSGEPKKRPGLLINESTEYLCGACSKADVCLGCPTRIPESLVEPKEHQKAQTPTSGNENRLDASQPHKELLFRCLTCKRPSHYDCLRVALAADADADVDAVDAAEHFQQTWLCSDCVSYRYEVDRILAWRPYPENAVEPAELYDDPNFWKSALSRKYLIKWKDRSFRRTTWVPHMWLVSTAQPKLRHFILNGSHVQLQGKPIAEQNNASESKTPPFASASHSREATATPESTNPSVGGPIPDAEARIPTAWKTVDRVLDVLLWRSNNGGTNASRNKSRRGKRVVESDEDSEDSDEKKALNEARQKAMDDGEQPSSEWTETVKEFERRTKRKLNEDDLDQIAFGFFKWDDLGYEEATWDSPPPADDLTYSRFRRGFERFLAARKVVVPKYSRSEREKYVNRPENEYMLKRALQDAKDLDLGQDSHLQLMPFQVDGFNWLCNNWWNHQPCILADEMGLGKTVQISSFIGNVFKQFNAMPALVVVPNSTIANWVREFERWAPNLTVVPFYGEARARDVIKKFELIRDTHKANETAAKFHVLVATYESVIGAKDFTPIFKNQPNWEILVIDEGQRLKSDTSLLFRKLNELQTNHRVIMTGTPLNNNIRELFNLMHFLDPDKWNDLEELAKKYEELTEERVKDLHLKLRPYFLRRIKSEVVKLPPKNEIIVPVSMTPLQKEVYRGILSRNADLLKGLVKAKTSGQARGKISNVLMELRKSLQHPYLHDEEIEPRGLSPSESHGKLVDASAKLRFLRSLLPKLKQRGHRVLLFSQFKLALNVIEDFINGEGYKYLRLDGDTAGSKRQRGMDEFNREGSDVFIYLLTTRAGGVGINLFTADTVILFDPDFNPHQDLQAIARAHRFGQKKTCLVFKLMVKDSAEERIVQIGKKKLVLDHLIVQKMGDEEDGGEDVQSILTHGAKALFDSENASQDIVYSDSDVLNLIVKTETEKNEEEENVNEGAMSFSFAKVWTAEKDELKDLDDDDQKDSWANTLQAIMTEREKEKALEVAKMGRGARRAAAKKVNMYMDDSPDKPVKARKRTNSATSGSAYGSGSGDDSESSTDTAARSTGMAEDLSENEHPRKKPKFMVDNIREGLNNPLNPIDNRDDQAFFCGLCDCWHNSTSQCPMTSSSKNLAEYREMLLLHGEDEPWEKRLEAIVAIDEEIHRRGDFNVLQGQPLHLVSASKKVPVLPPANSVRDQNHPRPSTKAQVPSGSVPTTNNGPNLLKRPSPPSAPDQGPSQKKARIMEQCPLCGLTPGHIDLKDCPVVAQGPKSVTQQIARLDSQPSMGEVVRTLRKILIRQKRQDQADSVD